MRAMVVRDRGSVDPLRCVFQRPLSSTSEVTFTLNATLASYEVRLYSNDSYIRIAVSGTITTAWPTSAVSVNGVIGGSSIVTLPVNSSTTVVVANGPGLASDWVGMYSIGATDTSYASYQYLNGSQSVPS